MRQDGKEEEGAAVAGYRGDNLIFIVSQPKAGSTLLQRILAGHPDVQTSAETWLMLHPVYGLRGTGISTDYNANWASTGVREFLENYADGESTYRDGIRSFAETIYGSVLARHGRTRFLDKTPRYTMIIDELYELFPRAKFVLLWRNPLAILKSELHTYVGDNWPILSKFAPDLLDAPGRLIAAKSALGDALCEVRYEDLVTSPGDEVARLCAFLELDFREGMLDYSDTPQPKGRMNDPVGIHRHTAPSAESLGKWKRLADDEQTRTFALGYLDALGDDTVAAMGYAPDELRAEMRRTGETRDVSPVYPFRLAIRRPARMTLRERIASAYLLGAQQKGRVAGALDAGGVLLERLFGGAWRFVRGAPAGAKPAPTTDANSGGGDR